MKCSTKVDGIRIDELVDQRHPAVFQRYALKASSTVKFGQAVKIGADGAIEPAASGDTPYGIACEDATQGTDVTHASVLVHGTVKASKVLVGEAAAAEADIQKLKAAGIYVLN